MKKIALILTLMIALISCTKERLAAPTKQDTDQPTGIFIFKNQTTEVYRVELWRYNSGGNPPDFYTVKPSETLSLPKSIAGKYVVGILQMSGYTDSSRVDYGFHAELPASYSFQYVIN